MGVTMKRLLTILLFLFILDIPLLFSHPGRTDANGGHYNRKTGEYHYHNKPSSSTSSQPSTSSTPTIAQSSNEQQILLGKVIGVTDGDTITILDNEYKEYRIRLAEIDAPEKSQAFGNQAKKALSDKIFGKDVKVVIVSQDKYGRQVAKVYLDDVWINQLLVKEGWAWQYKQYSTSNQLADDEKNAREQKLGLWSDPNSIPPWEYRHKKSNEDDFDAVVNKDKNLQNSKDNIKPDVDADVYWINTNSGVRHNKGCRYYMNTKQGRKCGKNEGRACGICGG